MFGDDYIITNVKYLLDSKLIKFILKITQYSSGMYKQNEYKILNLITYPDKPLKTDQEIYEYYGINKTEQKLIEEIVTNSEKSKKTVKQSKKTVKKSIEKTISIPSKLFKTPNTSSYIFKTRTNDKGVKQIYNEETKRWNKDTKQNRNKILTLKK